MKNTRINIICTSLIGLLFTTNVFAGDRDFTYTYQSTVLDKGHRELELWFTYLDGNSSEFYNALNHRAEFEIGLGKHFQTAFYLNLGYSAMLTERITGIDMESGESLTESFIAKDFSMSFSNEWKWQLSDPVANGIGSALYGEFTVAPEEFEIEGKLILDKKFGNFVTALNLVGEIEFEAELEEEITASGDVETELEWEKETVAEIIYGLSYQFSPHFSVGLELKNENAFEEDEIESTFSAGPAISYKGENWWFAFTAMPEIKSSGEASGNAPFESRLIFSYHF
ncbi:MAG: hypothetical protein ACHQFW_00335 [Chitinophagales bacterium]